MFEDRRRKRNAWRRFAMYLGFNMRNSGIDSPNHRQGSFRKDSGRSSMTDYDSRRRITASDALWMLASFIILLALIRCSFGDCSLLELVIRVALSPGAGVSP